MLLGVVVLVWNSWVFLIVFLVFVVGFVVVEYVGYIDFEYYVVVIIDIWLLFIGGMNNGLIDIVKYY